MRIFVLHERGYAAGANKEYFNEIEQLAHWLKAQEADLTATGDHTHLFEADLAMKNRALKSPTPRPKHRRDTARRTVF